MLFISRGRKRRRRRKRRRFLWRPVIVKSVKCCSSGSVTRLGRTEREGEEEKVEIISEVMKREGERESARVEKGIKEILRDKFNVERPLREKREERSVQRCSSIFSMKILHKNCVVNSTRLRDTHICMHTNTLRQKHIQFVAVCVCREKKKDYTKKFLSVRKLFPLPRPPSPPPPLVINLAIFCPLFTYIFSQKIMNFRIHPTLPSSLPLTAKCAL